MGIIAAPRSRLPRLVAGLCILAAMALGAHWQAFQPLDQSVADLRMQTRAQPVSGDIVFVALDGHSLNAVGVWPWPRSLYGEIVQQALEAGAYSVLLDIDLSAASDEAEDAALEAALEWAGGFAYLAAFNQEDAAGNQTTNVPLSRFRDHADAVSVNVATDRLGIARLVPAAIRAQGEVLPSLASVIAGSRPDVSFIAIDYGLRAETVRTLPAIDILNGDFDPDELAGTAVVVGASALELRDNFPTPNQEIVPGAAIQILAAETLINQRNLSVRGQAISILLLGVLIAVGTALARTVSIGRLLGAVAGFVALAEIGALAAYHLGAIQFQSGALLVGAGVFMVFRVVADSRFSGLLIGKLTGERDRMRDILNRVVIDNFDGIVIVSPGREIVAASRTAKSMLGEHMVGSTISSALPAEFANEIERAFSAPPAELIATGRGEVALPISGTERVFEYVLTLSRPGAGERSKEPFVCLTFHDVTERRARQDELAFLSSHDPLTGALNRNAFINAVRSDAQAREHEGGCCTVAVLNLRRFKTVNDTLGHRLGDGLLQQLVGRLHAQGHTRAARLGADHFAIHAIGDDDTLDIDAIVQAAALPYELDGHHACVGASAGVVVAELADIDPETLIRRADMALAQAESQPGNRVARYAHAMDEAIGKALSLESQLRQAISNGELNVQFQPQFSLAEQRLVGAEALVRWQHPVRGQISPAEFIPIAEDTGLIADIGRYVLRESCRVARRWPEHVCVAVNLSPLQFELGDVMTEVEDALSESGLPPERLEVEITEGAFLKQRQLAVSTLSRLRKMGVRVAIDDFGTGYSSLAYIGQLPFDSIKIDRSFVDRLGADPAAATIVETVANLGRRLGKVVVAEGIETAAQAQSLLEYGCHVGQGYHLGRPGPAANIDAIVMAEDREPLAATIPA